MTQQKTWAELCKEEGQFPKMPESPKAEKIAANNRVIEAVFDVVASGVTQTLEIATITGIERQTVRRALTALVAENRIVKANLKRGKSSFVLPAPPPPPEPEKYPNTVVTYRHNSEPTRTCGPKQHLNPIRLPALPPSQLDDGFSPIPTAQTQQGRSTGENVGVSYAAGGGA